MQEYQSKFNNLVELFISNAKKFPARVALVVDDEEFTYQTLFNRARQIAASLIQLHSPYCALLCARGVESYIGLLASFMASKIAIPLSIKSPAKRNLQILNFTQAKILIVDQKCSNEAKILLRGIKQSLSVLVTNPEIYENLNHDFLDLNKPQDFWQNTLIRNEAYLLFTSGSTGVPKAVMTSHASAIEYINKMSNYYQPIEHDRFSQLTDLSFDVAMHELFLCWANGGCLYTINDIQLGSLPRFIKQHQLTFWTSVPSVVSLLKKWNRLDKNLYPSIRHSTFLGEPLTEVLADAWHSAAPNSTIDNLYGPTEATIIFTGYRWKPDQPHPSGYVPIGKPVAGQMIAILDEDGYAVAEGKTGELYLAGSQVATGYWRNPALSKQKFVTINVNGVDRNQLWYKTGDFVYWQEPFGLIFKGRDHDVLKVRGGRIERLEVEMVLREIAQTESVAIVPMQTSQEGIVLGIIAFLANCRINISVILKACRARLPDYMIPTKFIQVEELPYNKNGKVDYVQLTQQAANA